MAKKKTDISLPFIKVKDDEEGTYVKVGPIEVTDTKTEEKVRIGSLHISEGDIRFERSLNSKLEGLAWATFFILLGCVWLYENMYDTSLPGTIAIGLGVILLALNYTRSRYEIPTSTFTIVVGAVAIVYGVAEWFMKEVDLFALIVIVIGLLLVIEFARKR